MEVRVADRRELGSEGVGNQAILISQTMAHFSLTR